MQPAAASSRSCSAATPTALETLRPSLSSYASLVVRVGDLGAGMAAKIALMVVSFGKLAAAHEGMQLAHAAGVDLAEFARIVAQSETQSGLHDFFLVSTQRFRRAPARSAPSLRMSRPSRKRTSTRRSSWPGGSGRAAARHARTRQDAGGVGDCGA